MQVDIKPNISYQEFSNLDIRVGLVESAELVPNSEKLIKLNIDFGEFKRTILTGMQKWYSPSDFQGKKTLFVVNMEYRKMAGLESQGMLLSLGVDHNKKPVLIFLPDEAELGEGLS